MRLGRVSPILLTLTTRTLAWEPLVASVVVASACAASLLVLPAAADGVLTTLAVVVLACGTATAVDDASADVTGAVPTSPRTRLVLRALLAGGLCGGVLAVVIAVAQGSGAGPDVGELVGAWLCMSLVGLAAAAVSRRSRLDLPGVVVAAITLGSGLLLRSVLPARLVEALPELTTATTVLVALGTASLVLLWATRDPAGPR